MSNTTSESEYAKRVSAEQALYVLPKVLQTLKKTEIIFKKIQDLHYEYPDTGDCAGCDHIYPCPTIQVLGSNND